MANRKQPRRYPLVEWLSAAIGLVIVGTMFGFLAVEAVRQRDGIPPLMEPAVVGLVLANGHYVVEVEVKNVSRKTGAGVQIEGVLRRGGSDVETSTATIAYVPGESQRRAGLVFTRDPREYRLQLRVTGYERP